MRIIRSNEELKDHVYFIFDSTQEEFNLDIDNNVRKLSAIIKEFQEWIRKQLQTNEYISILGI